MGRWKQQDATVCIFGTVNCAFGENTSDARRIVDTHNADCDAYEALIADLEEKLSAYKKYEVGINAFGTLEYLYISDREGAKREDENKSLKSELARVKAESLRVVVDGEVISIDDLPGWEHIINDLYVYDGRTYINIDDERCYKVRLENWEDQG